MLLSVRCLALLSTTSSVATAARGRAADRHFSSRCVPAARRHCYRPRSKLGTERHPVHVGLCAADTRTLAPRRLVQVTTTVPPSPLLHYYYHHNSFLLLPLPHCTCAENRDHTTAAAAPSPSSRDPASRTPQGYCSTAACSTVHATSRSFHLSTARQRLSAVLPHTLRHPERLPLVDSGTTTVSQSDPSADPPPQAVKRAASTSSTAALTSRPPWPTNTSHSTQTTDQIWPHQRPYCDRRFQAKAGNSLGAGCHV